MRCVLSNVDDVLVLSDIFYTFSAVKLLHVFKVTVCSLGPVRPPHAPGLGTLFHHIVLRGSYQL